MLKKIGTLVLVLTMLVIVLAACNNEPEITTSAPVEDVAPAETTTTDDVYAEEETVDTTDSDETDTPAVPQSGDVSAVAYQAYAELLERMSGDGASYDADFSMTIEMTMPDGFSMTVPSTGNIRMSTEGDTLRTAMTMEMMGMGEMEFFMEMVGDEVTFIRQTVDGEEIDIFADADELLEMMGSIADMPEVELNAITFAEITEDGDLTVINLIFDGQEIVDFALASVEDQLGDLGVDMSMQIEDMPVTVVKDAEGNPVSMSMVMAMAMEAEGEEVSMTMAFEFIFNAFGDDVVVTMPA